MTRHVILDQELLQARDTKGYKAASWWKINRQGGKTLLINLVLCEKGGSCWYRIAIKDDAIWSDLFLLCAVVHCVRWFTYCEFLLPFLLSRAFLETVSCLQPIEKRRWRLAIWGVLFHRLVAIRSSRLPLFVRRRRRRIKVCNTGLLFPC